MLVPKCLFHCITSMKMALAQEYFAILMSILPHMLEQIQLRNLFFEETGIMLELEVDELETLATGI